MRTVYDLSPLTRSMIGFDRMMDMLENSARLEQSGYPPYDIEKVGEDAYQLTLAVAGFRPDEIDVTVQPNLLVVSGGKKESDENRRFLHRGIASRAFERRFDLADHVVVRDAALQDGVLTIRLEREVPEELRPRRIPISGGAGPQASISDQGATAAIERRAA